MPCDFDVGEDGLEGFEVAVDVADDRFQETLPLRASTRSPDAVGTPQTEPGVYFSAVAGVKYTDSYGIPPTASGCGGKVRINPGASLLSMPATGMISPLPAKETGAKSDGLARIPPESLARPLQPVCRQPGF